MRPYLTILRDSFHEALASRVLWMLLIVITILLVFIAPLGPKGLSGPAFDASEVFDPPKLASEILKDNDAKGPSVGKSVLSQCGASAKTRVEQIAATTAKVATPTTAPGSDAAWLAEQLNTLIAKPDFFVADDWKDVRLRKEAKSLQKEGVDQLSSSQRNRFHRLALEAAFPSQLALLAQRRESMAYFGFPLEIFGEMKRAEMQDAIGKTIFAMLKLGVGVAGILAGLFVTSTIMPQTFEAGAVDLLFSKPVVRSGVYLTKYLGGCSFVVIMAAYLIGGIWLLAGVRFGLWNIHLLATIPIFVFIFAVYYSVSCLAGAYWRNPIVSVTMAVALWVLGWVLTFVNGFSETYIVVPSRIIKVMTAGETPLSVAEMGQVRRWDQATNSWVEVFAPEKEELMPFGLRRPTPYAGPIYDPPNKRIVAVERNVREMQQFASIATVWVGEEQENFLRKFALKLSPDAQGTRGLLREPDGGFLLITERGLIRWNGEVEEQKETPKVAGFEIPFLNRGTTKELANVSPDHPLTNNFQAAMNAASGELALLDDAGLYLCRRGENGKYQVRKEVELELEKLGPLAFGGQTVVATLDDGRLLAFNATDGKQQEPLTIPTAADPNTLFASPDGKSFALLTRDKRAWLYDPAKHELAPADVSGQGNITALAYSDAGTLLVTDRTDRVSVYSLPDMNRTARYQPSRSWLRFAYDFLIYPLYRVAPKPRELDQLTLSLVSELDQTPGMDVGRDTDLNAPQDSSKWTPVRDNGLFIVLMLALGCWHVARRDY